MATGTLFEMQAQASFVHAAPLTEEFRPTWIADFVGLEKQKRVLSNLVKSPRCCALLFEGAPGTGKTTMATAFANELLATVWHIGSQDCKVDRLQEVVQHCNYVPKAGLKGFHVCGLRDYGAFIPHLEGKSASVRRGAKPKKACLRQCSGILAAFRSGFAVCVVR